MNTILASIFSPRKTSESQEAASSAVAPKSALSSKKLGRKSAAGQKMERSQNILNDTDISPISTKSPGSKSPDKKTSPERSRAESPARAGNSSDRGAEDTEYTFHHFAGYRWSGDSIEIEVEWAGGDTTWEREDQLHQDAPDALLEFWESQGGRPANPNNPDFFDIHAIRKHSKDRKRLLVEWVGYGPKDATWVPTAVVEETAPEVVTEYWKTVQPARPKQRRRRGA
ncbi:Chromo domain-like protein [Metarhizium album ARSEF 1941]|uniref:Chromo domain-like protein n=1 Tax=Metarhizium album (strain ARSEF 1941) TaxID=1081103 RepID=A0A0B2WNY8_METAS|nr:Chromo domain-like protein [Metarhizium album ARSEF 1941]KHN95202.1 Chromo domain-like protein [Metarhizium album ARSEF 1941]